MAHAPFQLVFPHIPKTGGTTLLYHFLQNIGEDNVLLYGGHSRVTRFFADQFQLEETPKEDLSLLQVLQGHGVDENIFRILPDADIRLLVVMRHPVSHTRSRYNHRLNFYERQRRTLSPEKFFEDAGDNIVTSLLRRKFPSFIDSDAKSDQEQALSILRKFDYVFTTEKLDEQTRGFMQEMGVPLEMERRRVAEKKAVLDVSDEELAKRNRLEMSFFETANQVLPAGKSHNPFGFDEAGKKAAIAAMRAQPLSILRLQRRAYNGLAKALCNELRAEAALEKVKQGGCLAIQDIAAFEEILTEKWHFLKEKLEPAQLEVSAKNLNNFLKKKRTA